MTIVAYRQTQLTIQSSGYNNSDFADGTVGVDNTTYTTSTTSWPASTQKFVSLYNFDWSSLGAGAVVNSLTLKIRYFSSGTATNPFSNVAWKLTNNLNQDLVFSMSGTVPTASTIVTGTWSGSSTFDFTQGANLYGLFTRTADAGTAFINIAYADVTINYTNPTLDDFDITQDLSVRVYSTMPSPWGTGSVAWNELKTVLTNVEIDAGINMASPLSMRMDPGRMSFTLSHDFDPIVIGGLTPNTPVICSVIARPDTEPNTETCLFYGWIYDVAVDYDADGNPVTRVECYDIMERINQMMIPSYYPVIAQRSYAYLMGLLDAYVVGVVPNFSTITGTPTDYKSYLPGTAITEPQVLGAYLDDIQVTEGSYLVSYPSTAGPNLGLFPRSYWNSATATSRLNALTSAATYEGFSDVHSDSDLHYCIQSCSFHKNRPTVNKAVVSLSWDTTQNYTVSDSTSITTYGERSENVLVNMDTLANAQLLADDYKLDGTHYPWMVDVVTHNCIRPDGKLSLAVRLRWSYDFVRVYVNNGAVLNQAYVVGRIHHTIDAKSWTADFTLIRPPFKMGA